MKIHAPLFHRKEIYILGIVAIVAVAIMAGLPFFLSGQTVTTGANPEVTKSDAVICEGENISYAILPSRNGETGNAVNLRLVFQDESLKNLAMYYDAGYVNEDFAETAENELIAAYNTEVARLGIASAEAPSTQFTRSNTTVSMSLFLKAEELNEKTAPLIMITEAIPTMKAGFIRKYEGKGLKCEATARE